MTSPLPPNSPASPPAPAAPRFVGSRFLADLATVPNVLTLTRIVVILIAASLFFAGHGNIAVFLAVLGGITDYLDGYLARRLKQVTRLGEILDQFSDIFFESICLYIAIAKFHFVPLWVMIAYLVRELWVTSIRRFLAGFGVNIASTFTGKLKTNVLMWSFLPTYVAILDLLPALDPWVAYLARTAYAVAIGFGYISGIQYTRQFIIAYDRLPAAKAIPPASVPAPAG